MDLAQKVMPITSLKIFKIRGCGFCLFGWVLLLFGWLGFFVILISRSSDNSNLISSLCMEQSQ